MTAQVAGYCPMGCGQTLYLDDGRIYCRSPQCPRGDAVSDLLADAETNHIVWLRDEDFTIRHPLRERLGDELLNCQLHADLAQWGPPLNPGKYRVPRDGDVDHAYDWEPLP